MPIKSDRFKSIGFDPDTSTLELEFTDGSIYQYKNVPEFKYMTLNDANPMEEYFDKSIKDKFKCIKIDQ